MLLSDLYLIHILLPEVSASNQPSLNVHPGYITIITAEQEFLQHSLQCVLSTIRSIVIFSWATPECRIARVLPNIDQESIK
jgi:hypothetical protein